MAQKRKSEKLIYRHVQREAYKAGMISLVFRRHGPRTILLPGREQNWWFAICARARNNVVRRRIPDIIEATRLHPPINDIAKRIMQDKDTLRADHRDYKLWAQVILKEWREQGCPQAGPQLVGSTLLLIEGKEGQLFLHCNDPQEKIRFVVGADLLKGPIGRPRKEKTSE